MSDAAVMTAQQAAEALIADALNPEQRQTIFERCQDDAAFAAVLRQQVHTHQLLAAHFVDATSDQQTVQRFWPQIDHGSARIHAISDAVQRHHRGRPWRGLLVAAGLLIAALGGSLAWLSLDQDSSPPSAAWYDAQGQETKRIYTAQTSRSLSAADGSQLTFAADSLAEWNAAGDLVLHHGKVQATIAKRPQHPLQIQAGPATVSVIGTAFEVERSGGLVAISVDEGSVQVTSLADLNGQTISQELSLGDATTILAPTLQARFTNPNQLGDQALSQWQLAADLPHQEPPAISLALLRELADSTVPLTWSDQGFRTQMSANTANETITLPLPQVPLADAALTFDLLPRSHRRSDRSFRFQLGTLVGDAPDRAASEIIKQPGHLKQTVRYEILTRPRQLIAGHILSEVCMRINGKVALRTWSLNPVGSLLIHCEGWDLEISNVCYGPLQP